PAQKSRPAEYRDQHVDVMHRGSSPRSRPARFENRCRAEYRIIPGLYRAAACELRIADRQPAAGCRSREARWQGESRILMCARKPRWRNWETRWVPVPVVKAVEGRVLSWAPLSHPRSSSADERSLKTLGLGETTRPLQSNAARWYLGKMLVYSLVRGASREDDTNMPLKDTSLRKVKPAAKPQKLSDGGGLHLLVQPTGSKLWR